MGEQWRQRRASGSGRAERGRPWICGGRCAGEVGLWGLREERDDGEARPV
jgi:hypothetical protein